MCDGGGGDSGGGGGGGDFGGGGDYGGGGDHFHDSNHHGHDGNHHGYHDDDHHYGNDGSNGPMKKGAKVVTLIVTCCLFIVFMVAGIALFLASKTKLDTLSSTDGTIIDTKTCSGGSSERTEAAVIEYFDVVNNATYQFTASSCSNPGPTIGKVIRVLYNPEVPGEAYDGSFMGLWLLPLLITGIGFCSLLGCCGSLFAVCKAFAPSPTVTKIEQPSLALTPSYPTAATPSAPPDPYKTSTEPDIKVNPYSTTEPEIKVNPYSTTASSNQYSTTNTGQTSSNTNTSTSIFDQLR